MQAQQVMIALISPSIFPIDHQHIEDNLMTASKP